MESLFIPLVVLVALNKKIVDFVKELLPNAIQNKVVQLIAWVVGVALAFGFALSDYGAGITVWDGKTLDELNAFAVVIFGLAVASGAGVLNDFTERRNPDAQPDPP